VGGEVDGFEPGADEGDQDGVGFGLELDGEQRCGVGEAATVRSGREFDIDDGADGGGAVEESAVEQIADVEGVGVKGRKGLCGDEELLAGEELGGRDGVGAGELEDDAAGVFAGGEPVLFDGEGGLIAGIGRIFGGCGSEPDALAGGENFRKVGKGFGEDFAAAALGTHEVGERDPARWGGLSQRRRGMQVGRTAAAPEALGNCRWRPGPDVLVDIVVVGVRAIGFNDIEGKTVTKLHAGGAKDGAQGPGRPALLSYDFTDIRRSDVKAKDGGVLFGQNFDLNGVGVID
jgi:hypothetical protein